MAKKQPQAPLVSSVSTTLKKTINTTDTMAVTPEEIKAKKSNMMEIIDKSLDLFKRNLADGKVEMNSSIDLERLVKLTLILSGEADSVTGKPFGEGEQETTVTTQSIGISMSKIDEILDLSDPDVKAMYSKLSAGMNELNDIDD